MGQGQGTHGGVATSARGMVIPMFPLRIPRRVRRVSMPSVLLALASACATGLGAKAVPSERPDYNRQIVRANDAELLLNLVRLRYNDAMLFPGVGGVVAQYAYDATLNAGGQAGGGTGSATFGTALAYGEKPTITYTPLVGEEAAAPSVRSSRRRPKARGQQLGTREIGLPCER
jgi:hypothetical protein